MTAWGKPLGRTGTLSNSLGKYQPFRYRGYVYDTDTQWYYLQSRYYDPTTCRFISADVLLSTGQGILGYNCFSYCNSNPVNMCDSNGYATWPTTYVSRDGAYAFGLSSYSSSTSDFGGAAGAFPGLEEVLPAVEEFFKGAIAGLLAKLEQIVVETAVKALIEYNNNNQTHRHHIIPQNASNAFLARYIYTDKCNTSIDDPENIVELKQSFHAHLHTNEYYYMITSLVCVAYCFGGENGVHWVVNEIKALLIAQNNLLP